jgi:hypothetical protein
MLSEIWEIVIYCWLTIVLEHKVFIFWIAMFHVGGNPGEMDQKPQYTSIGKQVIFCFGYMLFR